MSLGPIPFEAIDRYATRYRIRSGDEFDEFLTLLRAMDRAYLDYHQSGR